MGSLSGSGVQGFGLLLGCRWGWGELGFQGFWFRDTVGALGFRPVLGAESLPPNIKRGGTPPPPKWKLQSAFILRGGGGGGVYPNVLNPKP